MLQHAVDFTRAAFRTELFKQENQRIVWIIALIIIIILIITVVTTVYGQEESSVDVVLHEGRFPVQDRRGANGAVGRVDFQPPCWVLVH